MSSLLSEASPIRLTAAHPETAAGLRDHERELWEQQGFFVRRSAFEGHELQLSGVVDAVDVESERKRLEKVVAEKEKAVRGYQGKLSNAGYVNNAPPEVVAETRTRLEQAEADLAAARRACEALG